MPKMKTHSGAKKRFRITAKGKVKAKNAFSRHMMMNKSKKSKRHSRGTSILSEDITTLVLRNWLPYGRKKKKAKSIQPAEKGVQ